METRSKFACLYIDDDSDEGFTTDGKKSSKISDCQRGDKHVKNSGKLIVHAVEKRPKTKKTNKGKIVDKATGLIVQGADEQYISEQKYREDLKQAMERSTHANSRSSVVQPEATMFSDLENKESVDDKLSPLDKVLRQNGEELQRLDSLNIDGEENSDPVIVELYKRKLNEAVDQMIVAKEEKQSAQAELEKYKTRYKKLVELFRDAEVADKAKLITELEKSRNSEAELASQLIVTQKELEQYKSKLRALGALTISR
ncbi:hypothetical protein DICVIV_03955 [Dictyocaulus viviparus]|uniref:Uncharacterized protein n=1 Tax=Dictyocaulus viviparus TaxID=29172 RepID=A0A0D8XZN0_DICVI|nr:hypothetical protein DICVIV_03955 [Dictyocaulus viviparus]